MCFSDAAVWSNTGGTETACLRNITGDCVSCSVGEVFIISTRIRCLFHFNGPKFLMPHKSLIVKSLICKRTSAAVPQPSQGHGRRAGHIHSLEMTHIFGSTLVSTLKHHIIKNLGY